MRSHVAVRTLMLTTALAASGTSLTAQARTPEQLFERYTNAIDPQDKLSTVKGIRMVSEFTIPSADAKMKMTMAFQRPGSVMIAVEAPGRGEMRQGYDGAKGWSTEGGATRELRPEELTRMKEGQGLESMGRTMSQFAKVEKAPERTVDGKAADCLELSWKSGMVSTECYSRETGLIVESRGTQPSPQGETEITTRYFDYEPEEGILVARRMEVTTPGMAQTIRVTEVEIGAVDPKLFAPPVASASKRP